MVIAIAIKDPQNMIRSDNGLVSKLPKGPASAVATLIESQTNNVSGDKRRPIAFANDI